MENNNLREKLIEKGKELLKVSPGNDSTFKVKDLKEDNAIYMYQKFRGGGGLIMDYNGDYLFFASCVNFNDALEKFREGKRSNN